MNPLMVIIKGQQIVFLLTSFFKTIKGRVINEQDNNHNS